MFNDARLKIYWSASLSPLVKFWSVDIFNKNIHVKKQRERLHQVSGNFCYPFQMSFRLMRQERENNFTVCSGTASITSRLYCEKSCTLMMRHHLCIHTHVMRFSWDNFTQTFSFLHSYFSFWGEASNGIEKKRKLKCAKEGKSSGESGRKSYLCDNDKMCWWKIETFEVSAKSEWK